jgi:hypothetical protein
MLWAKGESDVTATHLRIYDQVDKSLYLWMPPLFNLTEFTEKVTRHEKDIIINLSLPHAQVFFKADFILKDSNGLKFHAPIQIHKIQRRKNARHSLSPNQSLIVEFQYPTKPESRITKKVIDISAGGLSFLVAESEKNIFRPGLILNCLQLNIRQKTIETYAEIRHVKVLKNDKPDQNIKVGIIFRSLLASSQNLIASYVFEETSKAFAMRNL